MAFKIVFMDTIKKHQKAKVIYADKVEEAPVQVYLSRSIDDKGGSKDERLAARKAFMRVFGQSCRQARESARLDINEVASKMGVHRNTVWNIERGDSLPDAFDLEILAHIYGKSVADLMATSKRESGAATAIAKSLRAQNSGGYVYVPEFDVKASAGNGFFNDIESVVTMRPFDESFIRGELGIRHEDLGLLKVIGQSMEPDLRSRDTVLVDLNDRNVVTDGIHILRLDGALLIKKVQRLPGKVLRVSSSNSAYESFDISGDDENSRDFQVLGRIRWAGVTFS